MHRPAPHEQQQQRLTSWSKVTSAGVPIRIWTHQTGSPPRAPEPADPSDVQAEIVQPSRLLAPTLKPVMAAMMFSFIG